MYIGLVPGISNTELKVPMSSITNMHVTNELPQGNAVTSSPLCKP